MKLKINRKHFVEVDDIEKIEQSAIDVRVYLKEGYPHILKADCDKSMLLLRMVNIGVNGKKIQELKES